MSTHVFTRFDFLAGFYFPTKLYKTLFGFFYLKHYVSDNEIIISISVAMKIVFVSQYIFISLMNDKLHGL